MEVFFFGWVGVVVGDRVWFGSVEGYLEVVTTFQL